MDLIEYYQLVNYLETLQLPENLDLKEQRKLKNKAMHYLIDNNILFRRNKRNKDTPLKVIRSMEVEEILFNEHSMIHSGHFGIEATYHRISYKYYWPKMHQDIENYIKACDVCQRKGKMKKNNPLHPIETRPPFEKIGIDLIGPLPITSNQNRYIVVAIDYGTKWAEARAIKDAAATTIVPFLYEDIICRHGFPKELISDRGTTFANELIRTLCQNYQIKHHLSAPYHPQTNGLVERLNRTLCESIAKFVQLHKNEWDFYLPSVLFAYRTMQQSATKFTPFYLTYGRQALTPLDFKLQPIENQETTVNEIIKRACTIVDKLEIDRTLAQQNVQKSQQKQKESYQQDKHAQNFFIGDKVLMKRMEMQHWHHEKFSQKWKGPFYIHEKFDKGTYRLRTMDGKLLKNPYNGDHLKRYIEDNKLEPIIVIQN
jgi:Integrase zinc binding domain/Integrase core domain